MSADNIHPLPSPPKFDAVVFSHIKPVAIHSDEWFLTVTPKRAGGREFHAVVGITARDPDARATLEGVPVRVAPEASGETHEAVTGPRGQASLRGLPFGTYVLSVGAVTAQTKADRTPSWTADGDGLRVAAKDAEAGDIASEREPD
jgi:hypothetical protein